MSEKSPMKDVQNFFDHRGIAIQKVGVNDVYIPFLIKKRDGGFWQVAAKVRFTVALPKEYKGTHMSRFVEILNAYQMRPIAENEMAAMLDDALSKLNAEAANIKIAFKYFVEKEAPASKKKSLLDIDCCFWGEKRPGSPLKFTLGANIPFTSLCPCSKEISRYGAHNQRSLCRVKVRFAAGYECIYIEDLAALIESQASAPLYTLLKREDEKFVTERAYENPKFVEDILRDAVIALRGLDGIEWFSIVCENFESIHNHNAYAVHEEYLKIN